MITLKKGPVTISVEAWLKAQHPYSGVDVERYLELYGAELQREGWEIHRPQGK